MKRVVYRVQVDGTAAGWRVAIVGVARVWVGGPYATVDAAHRAVHVLVVRWQARARARGGWVWRPRGSQIGVALPDHVEVRDALPFEHDPCVRSAVAPLQRDGVHASSMDLSPGMEEDQGSVGLDAESGSRVSIVLPGGPIAS